MHTAQTESTHNQLQVVCAFAVQAFVGRMAEALQVQSRSNIPDCIKILFSECSIGLPLDR